MKLPLQFVLATIYCFSWGHAQDLLPGELPVALPDRLVTPHSLPTITEIVKAVETGPPRALAVVRIHNNENNHYAPAWSGSGKSLVFLRSDLELGTRKAILQRPGGTATTIYSDLTSFEDLATWSIGERDNMLLASTNDAAGNQNIHVSDADGKARSITSGSGIIDFPTMYSDVRRDIVVFRRDRELFLASYEIGASQPANLKSIGEGEEAHPSPNGKYLAVVRRNELGDAYRLELREMHGDREKPLLDTRGRIIRNPRFSPDSAYVAFHTREIHLRQWQLWAVAIAGNGSEPIKLVSDVRVQEDFRHVGPSWSPHSTGLWYFDNQSEQAHYQLKFVSLRNASNPGTVEYHQQITSAGDAAINPNPDRPIIVFSGHTEKPRDVFAILLSRSP